MSMVLLFRNGVENWVTLAAGEKNLFLANFYDHIQRLAPNCFDEEINFFSANASRNFSCVHIITWILHQSKS